MPLIKILQSSASVSRLHKVLNNGKKELVKNAQVCYKQRAPIHQVITKGCEIFSQFFISIFNEWIDEAGNSSYTGRQWYRMCSCQPTVELITLSLHKFSFHCTKSLFYVGWRLDVWYHSLTVYEKFPGWRKESKWKGVFKII